MNQTANGIVLITATHIIILVLLQGQPCLRLSNTDMVTPGSTIRPKILLFIFRADLRLTDHAGIHALATPSFTSNYTHLLPLYVFSPRQIEVSGFLKDKNARSPFPPARSHVGKFWRCGPHRVRQLKQSDFLYVPLMNVG